MNYCNGNQAKCIKYLEEVVSLMDDNPMKYPIKIENARINLAACYLSAGNNEKFKEMIQKAMQLCFTSDIDYFKMLHPGIAECLNQI